MDLICHFSLPFSLSYTGAQGLLTYKDYIAISSLLVSEYQLISTLSAAAFSGGGAPLLCPLWPSLIQFTIFLHVCYLFYLLPLK